jgi:hypothetical protein
MRCVDSEKPAETRTNRANGAAQTPDEMLIPFAHLPPIASNSGAGAEGCRHEVHDRERNSVLVHLLA